MQYSRAKLEKGVQRSHNMLVNVTVIVVHWWDYANCAKWHALFTNYWNSSTYTHLIIKSEVYRFVNPEQSFQEGHVTHRLASPNERYCSNTISQLTTIKMIMVIQFWKFYHKIHTINAFLTPFDVSWQIAITTSV